LIFIDPSAWFDPFDGSTALTAGYFDEAPFGRLRTGSVNKIRTSFLFFSLTIAIILYKYMHIYLWTALRIGVFERGIYGFCTEI